MTTHQLGFVETIAEIGRGAWSELEGPEAYPFLRYDFLLAFEESGCLGAERGWIPRHVVLRRGRQLLAVVPAYIKLHSFGEFVFDQGWADFSETRLGVRYYPKLVLAVPFTPATGPRILFTKGTSRSDRDETFDLLTGALPEVAEKLGLSSVHGLFLDDESTTALVERGWALRHGLQFQFHNPGARDFEGFLERFRAKRRAAIRRECRAVTEQEIRLEVLTGDGIRSEDARLAHELYLTTVDKHVWGRRYLNRSFFERVMQTMPDAIHFVVARDTRGEVMAGAFNLLGEQALYGRYWGTFVDVPFLHFNVCLYEGIRECLARGLSRFEPGTGGAHKEGRGFDPTLTSSVHYLADRTLDAAVRDFCRRESDELRAHVEGHRASQGSTDKSPR